MTARSPLPPSVLAELHRRKSDLHSALGKYDPVTWVTDRLGEFVWSKQCEILNSVRDNRRTAVHSCHSSGKSWLAARIAAWWIETHKPGEAFVVTSAPTGRQVRAILWREIRRAHSRGSLRGRTNQTEWWLTPSPSPENRLPTEEIVAFGQKPSDLDPDAFQGVHARYVLTIFDEACGLPVALWIAADTLISNEDSRFLAIGNPDDPSTEFKSVCSPGSGWSVIGISAFDTPNFTDEQVPASLRHKLIGRTWVEEKRAKWGESNPLYISKILGRFPVTSADGLIPISWIRAAQKRVLAPGEPVELGVDVGGGGDKSIVAHRRGPVVRIIRRDQNPDTMQTCGNVIADMRSTGATRVKVDEIGIGRGVVDRAREVLVAGTAVTAKKRELLCPVKGINVGQAARNSEAFTNLRAEGYWGLRERFEDGTIDIDADDDDLAAQLADLQYKRTSAGKIQMESKAEIKRRGKASPDEADALMLAFLQPIEVRLVSATWGVD